MMPSARRICALLVFLLATHVSASRLHRVSTRPGSVSLLRGRTLISGSSRRPSSAASLTSGAPFLKRERPRLLEFSVHLKKNSVVFDELEEDGIKITSCSRNVASRKATVQLSGANLDASDFGTGNAFVVDVDDWERSCGPVQPVEGIDEADDVLFYIIDSASVSGNQITLRMSIVAGSEVAPEVDIDVKEEPVFVSSLPHKVVFDDSPLYASTSSLLSTAHNLMLNDSLSHVSRPTISRKAKVNLFNGAVLEVDASLSARVYGFKVKRLRKTEVEWQQSLNARLYAELTVDSSFKGERSGEIFRRPIPKFGFSKKIPFVGRLRAGAFGKLEWVAEVDVSSAFTATIRASHETAQRVTARVIPPRLDSKNMLPANKGSSGSSTFKFKDDRNPHAKVVGFVGVRPAIGVELTLGKKGIEGNIGAKLGLEAETRIKHPPFSPYTRSGWKIGTCSRCHKLQGGLNIRGKDLGLQLVKNGRVSNEKILIRKLFVIRLGTICALPSTCSVPTPRPSPRPSLCRRCSSNTNCPSGYSCRSGKCIQYRRRGQSCGACKKCRRSICIRRRCRFWRPLLRPDPLSPPIAIA